MFGSRPELDEGLAARLGGDGKVARRRLADNQDALRAALQPGEIVRVIAVEDAFDCRVAMITSRRLLIARKGRVTGSYEPARISRTRLGRRPNGTMLTLIDGPGLVLGFLDHQTANLLAVSVDNHLLAPPPRSNAGSNTPRDIAELLPDYYRGILFATGKPDTPDNIVALIELVGQMLTLNAMIWFGTVDDKAAEERFLEHFRGGGPTDRLINMVDDMIDFLWAWSPRCHEALRDFVREAQEVLTGPKSQLWRHGDDLPMGLWEESGEGDGG
ncbi:hypothetical protein GA0115240_101424 [Streptomyces sp. DvalAA-14]|uniref:hypothetical protein n=1 Tax=unclassified Streptomyces TaxID=2593676 RepID=UPI00081B25CA|nr:MULTISPECIES: hypothetical protein [unclassified Streptomyces]MYS18866.1 hypothetical protein [Streptomyces sp. SID4948]SCD30790.1 hypothetical protein GA0115240_101424 [Streptomyces sp. DvalAA-14]